MQHGEVDRALDIEAEAAFARMAAQHVTATGFDPKPAEYQIRTDTAPTQLCQLTAIEAGQHDRSARVACGRCDQAVEQVRVLDLVPAPKRLDDALDMTTALTDVLHEVEIFIRPDLLDADEHGAETCQPQDTTPNRGRSSESAA